ncbi:DciA family protein [Orbaceae bacterium ac157xtp]
MRNNMSPQPINRLFDHLNLKNIQAKSGALTTLNAMYLQLLPNSLNGNCRVANYRQGVLIVEVSTASWMTRLRYEQERIISTLRKNKLPGLASIQYKVNPSLNISRTFLHSEQKNYKTRTLSPKTANVLLNLAEDMPAKLKMNLIKLAKHATKLDNK